MTWQDLITECNNCTKCGLSKTRNHVVFGKGNPEAPIIMVGEGPGQQEDETGIPFVGAAGKLLDLLLAAQGFKEEDFYISNIVKCRPPGNRTPTDGEADRCLPYLRSQVKLIKPDIIVCLGATALKYLIGGRQRITQIRGTWIKRGKFLFMPTFHPAALLRDGSKRELMWADFKKIKSMLHEIQDGGKRSET